MDLKTYESFRGAFKILLVSVKTPFTGSRDLFKHVVAITQVSDINTVSYG